LLDELGSGTDPQEGGAIAMAVLDELIQRKSFVLVTTHHGLLKNYGYSNEYCINASVDFDSDTLSPTYRLQMGIPGESHALDIANRSGLPAKITDRARSMLAGEQADVSSLIKGLTKKHEELSELEEQIKDTARRQHEKKLKYEQREIDLRKRELEINEREHLSESRFLSETRKELENLVRIIREGEITREKTLAVKDFISSLTGEIAAHEKEAEREKASLAELQKKLDEEKYSDKPVVIENGMIIARESTGHSSSKKNTKKRKSNKESLMKAGTTYSDEQLEKLSRKYKAKEILLEFVPGNRVLLPDGKTQGELLGRDGKNTWQVQVGSLKMSFKEKELTLTAPPAGSKVTYTVEFASKDKTDTKPVFELRLLGMREEEAIKALSRQLDLCTIHNFKNFSIIHGKGNGILQQSVHDYLSNYPGVRDFHFAHPEDGGTGKTYVELV
ncbi:MAG: Smr/MutS family protein, partial [Treponema sp.]|nr:Smr/MutS family protein [Treponema sp.]